MSSINAHRKIHRWVYQMVKELPPGDVILKVADRMCDSKGEQRRILTEELINLLIIDGDFRNALHILDMMIEEYRDDVLPNLGKASLYLYFLDDPEEALRCVSLALEHASRSGFFLRHALGYKARALLDLGRGQELSDVLEEIIALKIEKSILDSGRERDFVDRAPPGLIREDVLARYNEFRPKRPGDSMAKEPPKYEFRDDQE